MVWNGWVKFLSIGKFFPGLSFIYENKDRNKGMVRNTVLSLSYGNIRIKGENELTGLFLNHSRHASICK